MPYFITDLKDIGFDGHPEFRAVLSDLQLTAFDRAAKIWEGYTPGGITPGAKQFGVGPLRKNDMAGDTTDSTPSGSYTFNKTLASTGWVDLFNYTVRDQMLQGFGGFAFTDDVLRVTQLRMEIQDRRFPVWDLQLAQGWRNFGLVFKTDENKELIAEPGNRVLIRGYVESTGPQRVVPIGFQLYKNLNLVLTEV